MKYSIPELTAEEGIAKSISPKIYKLTTMLTLLMNSDRLFCTMAFTMAPFTSASQMLINVLNTNKTVNVTM